jgi:hypothetical protein
VFRPLAALASLGMSLASTAGAQVPGVVNGTGDDETLALLYGLTEFQNLDTSELPTRLWFDPYRGNDDTGNGSVLAPYRSVAKMKQVCTSHVRCTVYGEDRVFSPLTLRTTGLAPGANYQRGETVRWDGGASSGTVLDWSAAYSILVIDFDAGSPPVDGEVGLTGASSGATGNLRTDPGILNTVGGHVVYSFPPTAVTPATGVITLPNHSYVEREGPMRLFSSGALPSPLAQGADYTICSVTGDSFRLDDDADCSSPLLSFASQGSGHHGIAGASNAWTDDPIDPVCNDPDRICVLFESLDPAHPAVIDGNGYHVTGYDNRSVPGVFGPDPDNGLAYVTGAGQGWVGWQNIRIQNVATDGFSNQSAAAGKLIALNSPARDIRNGSENRSSNIATNNCYTSHGNGAIIGLNGGGSESRVDDANLAGTGACLAPTGTAKFTMIGTGTFRSERVGAFASATLAATGNDITLIGHELVGASTGNSVIALGAYQGAIRLQLARSVLRSSPVGGGSALGIGGGGFPTTVRIFESTLHGDQTPYGEAILIGNLSTAGLDFSARGLLIDDYPLWLETQNRVNSLRYANPFELEGYFDDEDAAGGDAAEFLYGTGAAPAPTTVASAQAVAVSLGAVNWRLYQKRSRNSNDGSPGTAWLADALELRCQPSEGCWGGYRDWYTVALGTIYGSDLDLSCLPADVLGERICALRLRGRHIGARGAPDADGDLLADSTEGVVASDPNDPDTDGDGLLDGFEYANGFDPLTAGGASEDADDDGLDNLGEQTHGTSPHDRDTDDDNFSDFAEVQGGSDPLDERSVPITQLPGLGPLGVIAAAAAIGLAGAFGLRARKTVSAVPGPHR